MSLARDYLLERGIIEPTITALAFELDLAPSVESFNDRLHRQDGQKLVPYIRFIRRAAIRLGFGVPGELLSKLATTESRSSCVHN